MSFNLWLLAYFYWQASPSLINLHRAGEHYSQLGAKIKVGEWFWRYGYPVENIFLDVVWVCGFLGLLCTNVVTLFLLVIPLGLENVTFKILLVFCFPRKICTILYRIQYYAVSTVYRFDIWSIFC